MRMIAPALVVAVVLVASTAHAQPSDAQSPEEARTRFREGVAAAEAGRWASALEAFEDAYEGLPVPAVLFNLAGALAQNGRLREAAEAYRRFERETPDGALRAAAAREREGVEARLARADVHAEGMQPGDRLAIDGEVLGTRAVYESVPLDPGPHEIEVRRGEERVASQRVVLGEGERREVVVAVPAPGALGLRAGSDVAASPPVDAGEPWWASPVLWTIVGVVVVGAGVGIGVGLATAPQGPDAPMTDRGPLGVR